MYNFLVENFSRYQIHGSLNHFLKDKFNPCSTKIQGFCLIFYTILEKIGNAPNFFSGLSTKIGPNSGNSGSPENRVSLASMKPIGRSKD